MAVDCGGGLPKEMLQCILECLPVFFHPCFAGVCVSWRSAVKERPSLPWLIYQTDMSKEELMLDFLGVFGREVGLSYRARRACSEWGYFCGFSVDGHWVVKSHSHHVTADNPVTGATIHFPRWQSPAPCSFVFAEPTSLVGASRGGLLAVVINHYEWRDGRPLKFARGGDDKWTELETPQGTYYNMVAFCDGKIYAAGSSDYLSICDLSGPSPMVTQIRTPGRVFDKFPYLVHSSSGGLLLVWKSYWGKAHSFGVARLDMGAGAQWVEVKSLGKDAILFDGDQAICISTEGVPELRRSCIYFPEDVADVVHLGIFNLENGRVEYHPLSDRPPCGRYLPQIFWYIPALV